MENLEERAGVTELFPRKENIAFQTCGKGMPSVDLRKITPPWKNISYPKIGLAFLEAREMFIKNGQNMDTDLSKI